MLLIDDMTEVDFVSGDSINDDILHINFWKFVNRDRVNALAPAERLVYKILQG
jgi:hypothetical protein